jgi:hypothetical protein
MAQAKKAGKKVKSKPGVKSGVKAKAKASAPSAKAPAKAASSGKPLSPLGREVREQALERWADLSYGGTFELNGPDAAYILHVSANQYTTCYVVPEAEMTALEREIVASARKTSLPWGGELTRAEAAAVQIAARFEMSDEILSSIEDATGAGLPSKADLEKVGGIWSKYLALSIDEELLKLDVDHMDKFHARPTLGAVIADVGVAESDEEPDED